MNELGLNDELCSWNSPWAATLQSKWFVFRENKSVFIVVNGVNNRINTNNHRTNSGSGSGASGDTRQNYDHTDRVGHDASTI